MGAMWLPLALCLVYHCCKLQQETVNKWRDSSFLHTAKVIICILLSLVALLDLFKTLTDYSDGKDPPPVYYLHPAINFISMCMVTTVTHFQYQKGIYTDGGLLLFWFLLILLGIVPFRSYIIQIIPNKAFYSSTFYVYYTLVVVQFVLHFPADKANKRYGIGEKQLLLGDSAKQPQSNHVQSQYKECPELKASFTSKVLFLWITRMIITGYKRTLTELDLWKIMPRDESQHIYQRLKKQWDKEVAKSSKTLPLYKFSNQHQENHKLKQKIEQVGKQNVVGSMLLTKTIFKVFGAYYSASAVFLLFYDLLSYMGPLLLRWLLDFVERDEPKWHGFVYVILMFITMLMRAVIVQMYNHMVYVTGMNLRSTVNAAVYRKSLKLSVAAKKTSTLGKIVNLMSVDAQRLQDAPLFMHVLWWAPFSTIIAMIFLWQELGPSALAGLVLMVSYVPFTAWISVILRDLQKKQMKEKDERMKLINEVLDGIKVLKLYAWELYFQKLVSDSRTKELKALKKAAILNSLTNFYWILFPYLVTLITFGVYVLIDPVNNILDAKKAFVSLSIFNIVCLPITLLATCMMFCVSGYVAMERIQKFLLLPELDYDNVQRNDSSMEEAIVVNDGTFTWDADGQRTLKNIQVKVGQQKLITVVGNVGSGKSSLISALLGEKEKIKGQVVVKENSFLKIIITSALMHVLWHPTLRCYQEEIK